MENTTAPLAGSTLVAHAHEHNYLTRNTCDHCGLEDQVGYMYHDHGTPVLFHCAPHAEYHVAFFAQEQINHWLSGGELTGLGS